MRTFAPSRVELGQGQVVLWQNRRFREWHQPLNDPNDTSHCGKCFDANCPMNDGGHYDEDRGFLDPAGLPSLTELQPGMRLLTLIDYCDRPHVAYQSLSRVCQDYTPQLNYADPSDDLYFFRPARAYRRPATNTQQFWASTRYLAVVPGDLPAFGKRGTILCFKRELARLSGLPTHEIDEAVAYLQALNPPEPLLLRPIYPWSEHMFQAHQAGDGVGLLQTVNYLAPSKGIGDVAHFIVIVTQRGELEQAIQLLNGWRPPNAEPFADWLSGFSQWLCKRVPDLRNSVPGWWAQWSEHFGISPLVPKEFTVPV